MLHRLAAQPCCNIPTPHDIILVQPRHCDSPAQVQLSPQPLLHSRRSHSQHGRHTNPPSTPPRHKYMDPCSRCSRAPPKSPLHCCGLKPCCFDTAPRQQKQLHPHGRVWLCRLFCRIRVTRGLRQKGNRIGTVALFRVWRGASVSVGCLVFPNRTYQLHGDQTCIPAAVPGTAHHLLNSYKHNAQRRRIAEQGITTAAQAPSVRPQDNVLLHVYHTTTSRLRGRLFRTPERTCGRAFSRRLG